MIDRALLAVIGAENATALELTIEGPRLLLSLPRLAASPTAVRSVAVPTDGTSADDDRYKRPAETVELITKLREHYGFGQDQFRKLHHFQGKASLEAHITYCTRTGRFTSATNVIVAKRLALCLALLQQGRTWTEAITRAESELKFPTT